MTRWMLSIGFVATAVFMAGCARREASPPPAAHQLGPAASAPATATAAAPEKWTTDRHTADSIATMERLVAESPARAEAATLADHAKLGADLQGALDELIRGCTMTGAAHDALHVFLVELMPRVSALQGAADLAQARQALDQVKASLDGYHARFVAPPRG